MLGIAARRRLIFEACEVPIEALAQQTPVDSVGANFGEHDEIPSRQRLLHPKGLPCEAFQFVAIHRSLCGASRNRQAEPRAITRVRSRENREIAVARARRVREDPPEVLRIVETLPSREA